MVHESVMVCRCVLLFVHLLPEPILVKIVNFFAKIGKSGEYTQNVNIQFFLKKCHIHALASCSVVSASAQELKGCGFDSGPGHMPWLQA